jgi:hypothetical protein
MNSQNKNKETNMKHIISIITFGAIGCGVALAQNDNASLAYAAKLKAESMAGVIATAKFGLMGQPVKGAPYAADGVNETTQTLGDGTHINRQDTYTIYRDGEGRMRRESGDEVWISDPVANASYVLNTRQQTARKMPLSRNVIYQKTQTGAQIDKLRAEAAAGPVPPPPPPPDPGTIDKLKAEAAAGPVFFMSSGMNGGPMEMTASVPLAKVKAEASVGPVIMMGGAMNAAPQGKVESLGRQSMEGVLVEGTRNTAVIQQGQIGNDRPMQIVSERWESAELHVTIFSKHVDPMMGERVERLTNVRRGEPDPSLFQVPAGYTVEAEK